MSDNPIDVEVHIKMNRLRDLARKWRRAEGLFAAEYALKIPGRLAAVGMKLREKGAETSPFYTGTLSLAHRTITDITRSPYGQTVTASIFIDPDLENPILGGSPAEYGVKQNQLTGWWDNLYQEALDETNFGDLWDIMVDVTHYLTTGYGPDTVSWDDFW